MEIIWWLIAISVVLVGLIAGAFLWAVNSGQFDNLDAPAAAILMDDDGPQSRPHGAAAPDEDGADGT